MFGDLVLISHRFYVRVCVCVSCDTLAYAFILRNYHRCVCECVCGAYVCEFVFVSEHVCVCLCKNGSFVNFPPSNFFFHTFKPFYQLTLTLVELFPFICIVSL